MFDRRLLDSGLALQNEYYLNAPFPHIVLDGFVQAEVAEEVERSFPDLSTAPSWVGFDNAREKKLANSNVNEFQKPVQDLLSAFNSKEFLSFLTDLTGIPGLRPDESFLGGGAHHIPRGGKLGMHIDFNKMNGLDRRINVLWYLNPGWKEEWEGHLELWTKEKEPHTKVLPSMNRLVIFNTTEESWHGHPVPLACPEGVARQSLALYYYTKGRPQEEQANLHSTVFV